MLTKRKPVSKSSRSGSLWAEREQLVSSGSAAYTHVVIERAENASVWDADGKRYIDFAGGIGALNVGHCHPRVVSALREQAGKLLHTSFHVAAYENYIRLCGKLVELMPGPGRKKAILFNSGSEAIENAIKFSRAHTRRKGVISFDNAFHGRTLVCLTLDGKYKPLRQHFGPSPAEFYRARYPYPYRPPSGIKPEDLTEYCLEELDRLFRNDVAPEDVAAIIAEPVQGEGGFIVPTPGFLKGLRKLCDQHGMMLVIDEVQTGFGRTGRMFAIEHDEVVPDLMVVGKSLGAGMPLSGVIGRAEILDSAPVGSIGGTYGGNPMSCAAALAVLEIFKDERLVDAGRRIGRVVAQRFDSWRDRSPLVGDSRGLGAMRAIELVSDKRSKAPLPPARVKEIISRCEEGGLIVIKAGGFDNVIRTLMPLTIPDSELERGLDVLESALKS
ncbi:MAG: aspartate aminotransferase family protein [Elusimicrobia bacterium]|nr:aspartate aminotransferase family protein [Elusimicrobiota bacterium]